MKIESRGKYPGVKIHLDPDECKGIINFADDNKLRKNLMALIKDSPNVFSERTPEEIAAVLKDEQDEATRKLELIHAGKKWNSPA